MRLVVNNRDVKAVNNQVVTKSEIKEHTSVLFDLYLSDSQIKEFVNDRLSQFLIKGWRLKTIDRRTLSGKKKVQLGFEKFADLPHEHLDKDTESG